MCFLFYLIQSYKAGWSVPIDGGHISVLRDLRTGLPRDFIIPSMSLGRKNLLRIITDPINLDINVTGTESQRALFISYRYGRITPENKLANSSTL